MKDEFQNYMGRPKRYDNIDGTGEICMGLMALGFTLLHYINAALPQNSMWSHGFASMLLFYAFILVMFGFLSWVPKAIKKRITWPRTGYVAFSRKSIWPVLVAVVIITAALSAGFAWLTFDRRRDWLSLGTTGNVAIFVLGYAYWVWRFFGRNHPWKWLALLVMALGLVSIALLAPRDLVKSGWIMFLFIGLMWVASGGITLYLYIRHTPTPAPEAE